MKEGNSIPGCEAAPLIIMDVVFFMCAQFVVSLNYSNLKNKFHIYWDMHAKWRVEVAGENQVKS